MKYILNYTNWLGMLAALIICASCSDDMEKRHEVVEGIPTTVSFQVELPDAEQITTKSGETSEDDRIDNLYLIAFNDDGTYDTGEKVLILDGGKVLFQVTSGNKYIYAVANADNGAFNDITSWLTGTVFKGDLDREAFLKEVVSLSSDNVTNLSGATLMAGGFCSKEPEMSATTLDIESCAINPSADGLAVSGGKIYLQRMRSEIEFKIKDSDKFTLTGYEIRQVPRKSTLFRSDNGIEDSFGENDYFTIQEDVKAADRSFSFYMVENSLSPKRAPNNIADREDATYYNPKSTYVVLKGTYKGETALPGGGSAEADAKVTYFVHLGKGAGSNYSTPEDFSTYRNKKYTYTIKVTGVKSIIAEVKTDEDNDPRAEGDVILKAGGTIIYCDAHYETRVISFKKRDLGSDLFYSAKTPFGTGDFGWVHFWKNAENNSTAENYPSEGLQNQLLNADGLIADLNTWRNSAASDDEIRYYTCFIDEFFYSNQSLNDFVNKDDRILMIGAKSTSQNPQYGNSSVLEGKYIFKQHSIKSIFNLDNNQINPWGIETWNETGVLVFGTNGEGSATEGKSGDSADNGYSNQVKLLSGNYLKPGTGRWDQIINLSFIDESINSLEKPTYNLQANKNESKPALIGAIYACMQRNRDENGNGIIEEEEVKWYLPAGNQYISLWMGADALQDATLYANRTRSKENHYFSSKAGVGGLYWAEEGITAGDRNALPGSDLAGVVSETKDDKRQYRCVRNLRNRAGVASTIYVTSSGDKGSTVVRPSNLTLQSLRKEKLTKEIGFDHLSDMDMSNRPYTKGFEYFYNVTVNTYYDQNGNVVSLSNKNWKRFYLNANAYPADSYCAQYMKQRGYGEGWRMPNQRELALMYMSSGNKNGGDAVSRTLYPYNPLDWNNTSINNGKIGDNTVYDKVTHTYVWDGSHHLKTITEGASLRCVRDVE